VINRVLYSAVFYPGDYGFVPRTLYLDGDPLDVLVYVNEPTFPGCQIDVRPIGVLRMVDKDEPDDKILAVPAADPFHREIFDIADLPQHFLLEVEHFFRVYKDLEGKRTEIRGREKSDAALLVVAESIRRYEEEYLSAGP
jgi:inorganic pyrophosphatase